MTVHLKVAAAVAAAGVVAALPAAASAKPPTKTVYMGLPSQAVGKKFQAIPADVNDFFPHGITVHVGQSVRFVPTGFHTLDIPPRGQGPIALISPQQALVSGVLDAAGQPFWFNNGQVPNVGFNPVLLKSRFGKHLSYRKTNRIESGLPLAAKPKPITVTFKKAGTFTYYCDIHPGMKGVVRVVRRKRAIPSIKADRRAVKNQANRDYNVAKSLKATKPGGGVVDVGVAGSHGEEYYGFAPGVLQAHVNDVVTFQMSPGTFEDHTATTVQDPGNINDPKSYLGALAASFTGSPTIDPRAVYGSDPPGTIANLTPTLHGNGFWNSGVMDGSKNTPLPDSSKVRFAAAGTYQFWCLIHPFMHLTVVVS